MAQSEAMQLNINHSLHTARPHTQQWVCSVYKHTLDYLPRDTLPSKRGPCCFPLFNTAVCVAGGMCCPGTSPLPLVASVLPAPERHG